MVGESPVMFSLPGGINDSVAPDNQGFDSPEGESGPTSATYTIPPVVWIFVLLVGGYVGVRWIMED